MSAALEPGKAPRHGAAKESRSGATRARAALRSVPRPGVGQIGDFGFVMILVAILVAGVAGLLGLNTVIQDRGLTVNELAYDAKRGSDQQAKLEGELEDTSSTSRLVDSASRLGMVPPGNQVGYLLLSNGTISGHPKPITGAALPNAKTPVQQAADAKAKADADAKAKADAEAKAKADAEKAKASASASPSAGASPSASGSPGASPSASKSATPAASTSASQGGHR